MGMWKDASVTGGFKDLISFARQNPKAQVLPAILSLICPAIIIFIFIIDSKINTAAEPKQEIVYVQSWLETRSDEEILEDRWYIQCLKDKQEAKRKDAMRKLGRMSGMDVEEIEREAEAKRKASGIEEVKRPDGLTC